MQQVDTRRPETDLSMAVNNVNMGSTGIAATFTASIQNAENGQVQVGLSSVTTATLKPGRYVYDVIVSDSVGEVTRVVEGSVLVRQGVTR